MKTFQLRRAGGSQQVMQRGVDLVFRRDDFSDAGCPLNDICSGKIADQSTRFRERLLQLGRLKDPSRKAGTQAALGCGGQTGGGEGGFKQAGADLCFSSLLPLGNRKDWGGGRKRYDFVFHAILLKKGILGFRCGARGKERSAACGMNDQINREHFFDADDLLRGGGEDQIG